MEDCACAVPVTEGIGELDQPGVPLWSVPTCTPPNRYGRPWPSVSVVVDMMSPAETAMSSDFGRQVSVLSSRTRASWVRRELS